MSDLLDRFPYVSDLRVEVHVGNLGDHPGEVPTTTFDLEDQPRQIPCPNCGTGEMDLGSKVTDVLTQKIEEATVHAFCDGQERVGAGSQKCVYRAHIVISARYKVNEAGA